MNNKVRAFTAALLITLGASSHLAHAQISIVTARPSPSDAIDWGQLNVLSSFQEPISTPQRFNSYDGITCAVGDKGTPLFIVRNFDNNPHYGSDAITTDFAPGDWAITECISCPLGLPLSQSQIHISFQQSVRFVGTQLGRNSGGPFIATLQVFGNNRLLGKFMENGNTLASLDNTAIFLGVMDTKAEITDVIYSVTDPTGLRAGILINQVAVSQ
jgi:hypothetical protein